MAPSVKDRLSSGHRPPYKQMGRVVRVAAWTRASYGGLCGMPACGQAVGYGVCDTPELWCGAEGLCARVRACAGAAESLHTYIQ